MQPLPKHALFGAIASCVIAGSAFAGIKRDYNESIDMAGVTNVVVEISSGSIHVRGSDRAALELNVEQNFKTSSESEADELEKQIQREVEKRDDTLYVKFKFEGQSSDSFFHSLFGGGRGVSFDTDIEAPRGVSVSLRTSGGHVKVESIDGKTEARTSGGHLSFAHLAGPVSGRTSGGHIDAEDIHGDAELRTSGGNIKIDNVVGAIQLNTSGGSISARNINGALDAHTSGGNVSASFDNGLSGDCSLTTSGGSVSARVPSDQAFNLYASTSGGGVDLRHSGKSQGSIKRNKVDVSINGGGPRLELKTSGGNIDISDT